MSTVTAVTSPTGATGEGGAAGGTTTTAPAAGAGGAAGAAPAAWTDGITDVGVRDFAVNKGYNKMDLAAAAPVIVQQYQHLEKLFGADRAGKTVELPDFDKAAPADLDSFYNRIGRPKEGKDYDLALPGPETGLKVSPEFETWARDNFHKAGLTGKQANSVGKAWNEFVTQQNAAETAANAARYAAEDKALKTEWGAAYDNKMSVASAAAKQLGVAPEALDALQKVAGYGAVMKTFANIAAKIGEDQFISGEGGSSGATLTPAEAQAALKAHQADKDWMVAWMDKSNPKHKEAVARKTYLTSLMVAGQ